MKGIISMENSTQKKTGNPGRDAGLKEKITSSAKVSTMHSNQNSHISGASQRKGQHIPCTTDSLHRDDSQAGKPISKFDQALITLGTSRREIIHQCMDMRDFARSRANLYRRASRTADSLVSYILSIEAAEDPNYIMYAMGNIGTPLQNLRWLSDLVHKDKLAHASAQTTAPTSTSSSNEKR